MTYKQIEDTTNNLGWGFKRNRKEFCFENWTSRGQNLVYENTCTLTKDIVEQVTEYVRGYDVDEEVSLYATSLGKNGVPATFKDLLKDMNEAKRMWTQLAKNLKKLK